MTEKKCKSDVDICDFCGCRKAIRCIQMRAEGRAFEFKPGSRAACEECRKSKALRGRFRYSL